MWIVAILQDNPVVLYGFVLLLGLVIGSFLNVVIVRLPGMLEQSWKQQCRELLELEPEGDRPRFNLVWPGSHCPQCKTPVKPIHNIPVLSYVWLGGRCAACDASISLRYPIVEVLAAVLAILVISKYNLSWQFAGAVVLSWSFLAMSAIDIEHHLLPDGIVLPLMWLGLVANSFGLYTDTYSSLYGAAAGYVSLWTVFQGFRLLTGKEGMGYGDFKLFACIGAWLGWQSLPLVILLAALCGTIIGVGLMLIKQHDKNQPIPFGPFLCAAGLVAMMWGPRITHAYLQFAGF